MQFSRLSFVLILINLIFGLRGEALAKTYLNGYTKSRQGEQISYHSPDPRASRASQEGTINWGYFLTCTEETGNKKATEFGWQLSIPLIGRVFPEGKPLMYGDILSVLSADLSDLLLINFIPSTDGSGIVIQLREISGKTVELETENFLNSIPVPHCYEVNAIGEVLNKVIEKVVFEPNSVHFLKFT